MKKQILTNFFHLNIDNFEPFLFIKSVSNPYSYLLNFNMFNKNNSNPFVNFIIFYVLFHSKFIMNNPNPEGHFLWAQPGNLCWIETSTEEKYVKATILQRNDQNQTVTVKYEAGNESMPSEISFFHILRFNEQSMGANEGIGFEDMVNMDVLNEAEVLNNLKTRYKKDLIFTYIGPTLLVINPYKPITSDFSPQNFAIYSKQALSPLFSLRDNPPHVFAIGAKAFHQLIIASKSQAIVISGESGAGKTENTKFAMRFITSLSSESLEEQKLQGYLLVLKRFFF